MVKEVQWTKYLWLRLLSFGAFMLEFLSILGIEVVFLHVDIQKYTMQQRSIHCIIMVFMWAFFIGVLLFFQGSIIIFQKEEATGIRFPRKVGS